MDELAIRSPAAELPAVWQSATTEPPDRRRIAGLLIEHVLVTVDKASERKDFEPHSSGGAAEPQV